MQPYCVDFCIPHLWDSWEFFHEQRTQRGRDVGSIVWHLGRRNRLRCHDDNYGDEASSQIKSSIALARLARAHNEVFAFRGFLDYAEVEFESWGWRISISGKPGLVFLLFQPLLGSPCADEMLAELSEDLVSTVEHHKSKTTQPKFAMRCAPMYRVKLNIP